MKQSALFIGLIVATGITVIMNTSGRKKISENGLKHLKMVEGLELSVYLDQAGLPTIGYGHLIKPGENFTTISEFQAETLLKQDVRFAEEAVRELVKVELTQSQFDALVSFVFNVGRNAFARSTLLKVLNAGNYAEAMQQMARWRFVTINGKKVVSNGLLNRRRQEQRLFLA